MAYADDLIFDVGLHRGEDALFYLRKGFRVIGVEAMPQLCAAATARLEPWVRDGRLTIVNAAVAERDGPIEFYANPNSYWGTTSPEWADRNAALGMPATQRMTVSGLEFGSLLERYGTPRYLKIDIEGADLLCLRALAELPADARPRFVSIESEKRSWAGLRGEFELLDGLGYHRYRVVAQHKITDQAQPMPAREGVRADHVFEPGSSGLFGAELPGRWQTRREALAIYRAIFLQYRLFGDAGLLTRSGGTDSIMNRFANRFLGGVGWYDTHAMLGTGAR